MAGQTINDRLLAAKHSLAGQGLAKSVCKATTEELLGPKKKHLDYLVHCTNEPNVSIPQMANLLIERSQNTSWIVVFKALISTHHIMCYGNERFTQYLASSNVSFQLSNFVDKGGSSAVGVPTNAMGVRTAYDMSPFIRRYSRYLNEKALSYRLVAFDFCKVKRGKEEGTLRTMNADNLLKTLPTLQNQLDALLEFDCTANDLTNGVINMCFMLLFRDLIRLFASYNDGIINLLEKYFEMNKKQCREALDLYKKFLVRMDRVGEFLKVAENIGIDKGDIPDLTKAPNSLLDALEQHLCSLEGGTPTGTTHHKAKVGAATGGEFERAAVAEEEAALNQYKAKLGSPPAPSAANNPFLNDDDNAIIDLFGATAVTQALPVSIPAAAPPPPQQPTSALDDLLGLGNPFMDCAAPAPPQQSSAVFGFAAPTTMPSSNNGNLFGLDSGLMGSMQSHGTTVGNMVPSRPPPPSSVASATMPMGGPMGAMAAPLQGSMPTPAPTTTKLLTGDLETSLNSLVENLTMNGSGGGRGHQQWGGGVGNSPMKTNYKPMQSQQNVPMAGMKPVFGATPQQQPFQSQAPQAQPQKEITFDPFGNL